MSDQTPQPFTTTWTDAQAAAIRVQLSRVLEGSSLRSSPRLQRMLRHIVDATLAGDAGRLKGYTLGVDVFDRGAGFDPNLDPIVRVEAGRLRSKLLAHYAGEGAGDAVRIDLPKGGYAARFVFQTGRPARKPRRAAGGAAATAPAPSTDGARNDLPSVLRTHLPRALDPLIGREADLEALMQLLARHRLVTVLGAGGIGKTRLAQAAAHAHVKQQRSPAAWVDLAHIGNPALLAVSVAQSLQLPIAPIGDPLPGLLAGLRPLDALLVLDNAEHVIAALSHLVRAVLQAAAHIRILVTSQAQLHIDGERVLRLAALHVPSPDAPLAEAARGGAVALFVDRAQALDHGFVLNGDNCATVVRLCARLDGLPLAIRLAAARLPLLGLDGLEARLGERLQLLSFGNRDAPPRQQTLCAALDWSCGLLAPPEQALFRRLGVFVGGFTIELALAAFGDAGADPWTLIDSLGELVERSLINLEPGDPPRYRMLEGARAHALHQLASDAGALHDARQHHARALGGLLRQGAEALWSMPDAQWLPLWAPELDNVRAALDWSERHDGLLLVSLIGAAAALFRLLDLTPELRLRAAKVDVQAVAEVDPATRAFYWIARAVLQSGVSTGPAYDFACRAEPMARAVADRRLLYLALCQQAASGLVPGERWPALLLEIGALESAAWPPRLRAQRSIALFVADGIAGRWANALLAAEAGFALAGDAGSVQLRAVFGNWIVVALLGVGDLDGATARSQHIRTHILPGPAGTVIPFIGTCARCALLQGDVAGAKQQLSQMFTACRTVGWAYLDFFAGLYAQVTLAEQRWDAAARLLGFANVAARRAWHVPRFERARDDARTQIESALGMQSVARLCAEGEQLDNEAVCALVLAEPDAA